jgi:hypothetical protein
MDWIGDGIKLVLAAVFGIVGKVIYDRQFAKKPDLRYSFGAPATFGTGERSRVYQNLEVSNAGTESTTDVRINFSLPEFDLIEHQVAYDGVHSLERTEDRATLVVPSLPPGDSLTVSFVFSPSKSSSKTRNVYLSARSKECLAKPLERAKGSNGDWSVAVFSLGIVLGLGAMLFYSGEIRESFKTIEQFKEQLKFSEKLQTEKTQKQVTRLTVQVANPATLGKEVEVECYLENLSTHRFTGVLVLFPPMGGNTKRLFPRTST